MADKNQDQDTLAGFAFALSAYVFWGFLPLFLKLVSHISPVEVVGHRIIWSVPLAAAVLLLTKRTAALKAAITSPRTLVMALVTALLIAANWSIYVWAIATDRVLDAALGYYINPLFSVFLAAILLREKLSRLQIVSLGFALTGVIILTVSAGKIPVAAFALTLTWGFYAYFKKSLPVGPNQGFMLEILILLPLAIAFMVYQLIQGQGLFLGGTSDTLLLFGCGLVTAFPLLLYGNGAKRLRLSTIAMMQYIAPTMIFLLAVFVFQEPFGGEKLIAFGFIWTSLAIFSFSLLTTRRP